MKNVKLSEEYIEENVFNSLWRVSEGISTVKKEAKYLTKKMLEVRKLLIESHLPHVSGQGEQLVNFLIYLNDKELINNHDFDYEKEAKKYLKKLTNCR